VNRIRAITLFLIVLSLLLSSCIKRVDRPARGEFQRYFPLNQWDQYQYSGPLGKAVVSGNVNELYTITYYDSTGRIQYWKDFLKSDRGAGWKNMVFAVKDAPALHFEPALPFVPWSHTVGDTLLFSAAEIMGDSLNTHRRIQVEYEILSAGPVITPAGAFNDCIQMRMSYKSLYGKRGNYNGDSYWWFARDIGLVKYIIFEGTGQLLSAKVDGKTYP